MNEEHEIHDVQEIRLAYLSEQGNCTCMLEYFGDQKQQLLDSVTIAKHNHKTNRVVPLDSFSNGKRLHIHLVAESELISTIAINETSYDVDLHDFLQIYLSKFFAK